MDRSRSGRYRKRTRLRQKQSEHLSETNTRSSKWRNFSTNRPLSYTTTNPHVRFALQRFRWWAMLSTPFIAFYIIGQIFQMNTLALIKMFLLTCLYAVVHTMGSILFYGELKNVYPLSVYLATKLWFYITWFIFFMPVVDMSTTLAFLCCSGVLWYCFLKAWKGDPGVIVATEEDRIKVNRLHVPTSFCIYIYIFFICVCFFILVLILISNYLIVFPRIWNLIFRIW